jgi:diguanylate cyclase (GGDEF)-like protein
MGLMEPDAFHVALFDAASNTLSFEISVHNGQEAARVILPLERAGLSAHIVRECRSLLVRDWRNESEQHAAAQGEVEQEMRSFLGVPMKSEGRVVGVLTVQAVRPHAFNFEDERLLMAVATQTAMAMENARLHALAQDQAKYDSLTGVFNHGHFVELVRQAVIESDRKDTQISLIMLDIDHFKQYNDTWGHVAGDNVLCKVAQALKESAGENDAVGRWGGEEFGVLLQGVGITEAKTVARTIRRAVAELYPMDGHGKLIPNPTVSQGISSYPYPSPGASDLIEQADAALYQAKKRGRNQLIVYEGSGMHEATITTGRLARYRGKLTAPTVPEITHATTGHLS